MKVTRRAKEPNSSHENVIKTILRRNFKQHFHVIKCRHLVKGLVDETLNMRSSPPPVVEKKRQAGDKKLSL